MWGFEELGTVRLNGTIRHDQQRESVRMGVLGYKGIAATNARLIRPKRHP